MAIPPGSSSNKYSRSQNSVPAQIDFSGTAILFYIPAENTDLGVAESFQDGQFKGCTFNIQRQFDQPLPRVEVFAQRQPFTTVELIFQLEAFDQRTRSGTELRIEQVQHDDIFFAAVEVAVKSQPGALELDRRLPAVLCRITGG